MPFPVFLIGARGCGKTTVGNLLAQQLEYTFRDTDQHLQSHIGQTIAAYVAAEGWDDFRQQEHQALLNVTAPATVIATGGGMILRHDNRRHMVNNGHVIWLSAEPQILSTRLRRDPEADQRPTLTGRSMIDELSEIVRQRAPLYLQTAQHIIDASQPPEDVVADILECLLNKKPLALASQ